MGEPSIARLYPKIDTFAKNRWVPHNEQMIGRKPRRTYLDYASATPVLSVAQRAVLETAGLVGNPGSIHLEGVRAEESLEESRETIARELGCKAREIIFTSGGTESNNLAILGFARRLAVKRHLSKSGTHHTPLHGTHWIVSSIEHASVLGCFGEIERLGGTVCFVDPDSRGIITPEAVQAHLKKETVFVSIGWANSEIGVLQPLIQIAKILRAHEREQQSEIIFHTDAGQAPLYKASTVHALGVDIVSLDAGKLYGPRGIGALWLDNRVELAGITFGGKQERGLRAGTESVALAAGFATALVVVVRERESEFKRLAELRGSFANQVRSDFPGAVCNGDLKHALPHILNISIPHINSEYVVLALDHLGFALSTKSACHEGEESQSHVVAALGGEDWRSQNTLRFSFGRNTVAHDITRVMRSLKAVVERFQKQNARP